MMLSSEGSRLRQRFINLAGSLYLSYKKRKNVGNKAHITLLNYHKISGHSFRKHLGYIRLHYQVLSPQGFLDWLDDKIVIDEPSVVFTFDDGYLSFYEEIYPIFKETKTPVFMFIPTGFVGKRGYLWFDELQAALEKSNVGAITVDDKRFYLYSRLYRSDFYEKILQYVCSVDQESTAEICKDIFAQLDVEITEKDMQKYRFLNWPQLLEMQESGLVVFGSHTVNHPNLTLISDNKLTFELQESKHVLENKLGKRVSAFAYPYGGRGFFDARIIDELERTGYSCAFTTIQGAIEDRRIDRFRLKRVMLFDYQNEGSVALKLDRFSSSTSCGISGA